MKKVLVLILENFEIYEPIKKNLEKLGYDVTLVFNHYPFRYPNFFIKIYNFIRKSFLGDKSYKKKLTEEENIKCQKKIISQNQYDITVVFRADMFHDDVLKLAKEQSKKMVNYQFDGIERNIEVLDKIKFFDKFYVFDEQDVEKYKKFEVSKSHNFYFDYKPKTKNNLETDFYFLGSYHKSRVKILNELIGFFEKYNYQYLIEIVFPAEHRSKIKEHNGIVSLKEVIPFKDYLEKIEKSKYILDLLIDEHSGLSFRVFESLYYEKKLISNNKNILKYDFYSPENIFIIGIQDIKDLPEFLRSEYKSVDKNITEKYSFTNWFNSL